MKITNEIFKLKKYILKRTTAFTLASVMAFTTTGCSDSQSKNILEDSYVAMIDDEIKLLQSVELGSLNSFDEFEHNHYYDLISSTKFTDDEFCTKSEYLSKDITILGTLTNYLTEEEIIASKNQDGGLSSQNLIEIYARLREGLENKGYVVPVSESNVGSIPFNTLVDGIDAKNLYITDELNGEDEVINHNVMLYIEDYVNKTPGLFDLFDNTFNILPCYRSEEEITEETKREVFSNLRGQRFSYPININEFLEKNGLSYFNKEKYSIEELEKLESLLNGKDVTKYSSDKIFVFVPAEANVTIGENEYNEELNKYYVVLQKESIGLDFNFECANTDVFAAARSYELYDKSDTRFNINAKRGTLSFEGSVNEKSLVPINDFLALHGLGDYTSYEYSMGQLYDINEYINSEQKVLVKE